MTNNKVQLACDVIRGREGKCVPVIAVYITRKDIHFHLASRSVFSGLRDDTSVIFSMVFLFLAKAISRQSA